MDEDFQHEEYNMDHQRSDSKQDERQKDSKKSSGQKKSKDDKPVDKYVNQMLSSSTAFNQ